MKAHDFFAIYQKTEKDSWHWAKLQRCRKCFPRDPILIGGIYRSEQIMATTKVH